MHRNRFSVCPKCESFRLLEPDSPPVVYCGHVTPPMIPWWFSCDPKPTGNVNFEKIQCKVVTIGDADENS